ncbi:protein involved in gliding motility GldD [Winogradskyella epiphytica]|uniref:Protein involved in gliding motility GldD n=1 Tax=Winogradskyella epiphytica TaxID=262005 RepID=A0A2V4X065_9FLAO|nr:gliding motility lipoprotein GldD [Winogradskyella epiphytica]PYE83068.1 protein involved in gliding motility GldD [Winogradskyella epiphytica]GGW55560.1 gliding motility lipoprotein GldD [Winogradskyella epiphytica]
MKRIVLPILSLFMLGCGDDTLPKPKAYLRLEYPTAKYEKAIVPLPFTFEMNKLASPIKSVKTSESANGVDIKYPSMKATIYLTYKEVKNGNLDSLLRDAQNLTQKHTIKADAISTNLFKNEEEKVYGMLYEIGGDAASQSQFYVTDSLNHFLSGSLYFYAKPNYDSIYPASEYLKKDIKRIMETVRWKE